MPATTIRATNSAGYTAPIGLTADPVVFTLLDGRLCVLLARRLEEPQRGMFALPGGFVGTRESRRPSGAPDWEIEGWVTSYVALPAGMLEPPSDTVERVLGRPPRTLAEVLREHPESLAHLRR